MSIVLTMLFLMPKGDSKVEFQGYSAPVNADATLLIRCALTGTGTVVGDDTIITANHVVGSNRTCTLGQGHRTTELEVIERDPANDFAVLRARRAVFDVVYPVNCSTFEPEQTYYLGGWAYGAHYRVNTLTAIHRYFDVRGSRYTVRLRAMSGTSASGMSGGPVVNSAGEVIGILSGRLVNDHTMILVKELRDTSICR